MKETAQVPNKFRRAIIANMISQFRMCLNNLPVDYEELIRRFLCSIPLGYGRGEKGQECKI